MTTGTHTQTRTRLLALATAVAAVLAATASPTAPAGDAVLAPRVVRVTIAHRPRTWSYSWPVKPFQRQHPIRAFLDDPRIGRHGSRAFHFGIDVAVPDGTRVYAVEAGTVYVESGQAIGVLSRDGSRCFGYWHIVPAVVSHQKVRRHQLLGRVAAGWGHVHFAERLGDHYVNPLRDGGIGPYVDRTAPSVDSIAVSGSSLVVVAHDMPSPRVPGPWADEPVTPALLRWRVAGAAAGWRVAVDFRSRMLPNETFDSVYTPATRQNHEGEPGLFSFYLERTWTSRGATIEVEATDTAGNSAVYALRVGAPAAAV